METEIELWLEASVGCKDMDLMKEERHRCISAEVATKSSTCMNAPWQFLHSYSLQEVGRVS